MANLIRKAPLLAILCASVALAQYPPIDPVLTGGTDDAGVKRPISVDEFGHPVTVPAPGSVAPLPAGAATAAKQDTGNTSLGTIATNSGTQATAANQSSQLTQETTTATNTGNTATLLGGTGSLTCKQATGTNLHAVLDTTSTTAVTQATGTNLHAVLDTTSTTAVTQATAANLNATVVFPSAQAVTLASTTLSSDVTSATAANFKVTSTGATSAAVIGNVGPSNTTPIGTLWESCKDSAADVLIKDLSGAGEQYYVQWCSVTSDGGLQQADLHLCGDAGASTILWKSQVNANTPPGFLVGTGQNENLCGNNLSGVQTTWCCGGYIAP